jgi:hypothetical protein
MTHRRVGLLTAGAVLLLIVVGVARLANWPGDGGSDPTPPAVGAASVALGSALSPAAIQRLGDNTAAGTEVAVPAAMRESVAAALPGRTVSSYGSAANPDLVVVPITGAAPPRTLLAQPAAVGSLGSGFMIRQLLGPGTDWAIERDARRSAGRELLENDALSFTEAARAALSQGSVDARLLTLLAGLSLEHRMRIDLPAEAQPAMGESLHLAADVLSVDGRRLADYPWGAATVKAFLSVQSPIFTPDSVTTSPDESGSGALAVRYLLPSPTGLLRGAGFPTTS